MQETNKPVVRRRGAMDIQSENAVRGRWLAGVPHRHRHWQIPESSEEATVVLVGELGGRVVGRCLAEAVYPPFGELQNMNVALPFRGQGVGSSLVDACLRDLTGRGCMAVFLQTHADNITAQRLYARKGFLPVARGEMFRMLRFTNVPLLDEFMHTHPLNTYVPLTAQEGQRWPLRWSDWATGDELTLVLTGGSSQEDSHGYAPGLTEAELRSEALGFGANLSGPTSVAIGDTIQLVFFLVNKREMPLSYSTRLLLPPGMNPTGQWDQHGPQGELGPGGELSVSLEVQAMPRTDSKTMQQEHRATFASLPLTLEVFVGPASFWLAHQVMVREPDKG